MHPQEVETIIAEVNKRIPPIWYEKVREREPLWGTIFSSPIFAAYLYGISHEPNASFFASNGSYIFAGLMTIAALLDDTSTIYSFMQSDKAREQNLPFTVIEMNPFLNKVKSAKEFVVNPKLYLLDLAHVAIAATIPVIGIGMSGMRALASLNNYRVARRMKLAIELAEGSTLSNI